MIGTLSHPITDMKVDNNTHMLFLHQIVHFLSLLLLHYIFYIFYKSSHFFFSLGVNKLDVHQTFLMQIMLCIFFSFLNKHILIILLHLC